ncbi:MAG: hypothetical protein JW839_21130 [Candidatus Lokiarchaeota archaeon]|nr:hypothetical protein [Candidatus Lokiarchaeota archaeon]
MSLKIKLPPEKEAAFREIAMKKFGYRKGSLSDALEEAITLWLGRESKPFKKVNNPTEQIRGMLSGIKGTSVDLQHEGASLFY